jgi:predicted HicB family RNase H-like nuclease
MTSKTKQSGRAAFLLRMPPELKARLTKTAAESGVTVNDLLIAAIEKRLAARAERLAKKEAGS